MQSKGKGKGHPRTGHEGPEAEQMYSSTLPSTSALDVDGWSTPRPGRFTPGKETRYPLYRRLGGHQSRSGRVRKISPPAGFDPRTVQPVAQLLYRLSYPGSYIALYYVSSMPATSFGHTYGCSYTQFREVTCS